MPLNCTFCYGILNNSYETGQFIKIQYCRLKNEDNNETMSKQVHTLVYYGDEHRLAEVMGLDLYLVEIRPINLAMIQCKKNFSDIAEFHTSIIKNSYQVCQEINFALDDGMLAFCDLSSCCYIILSIKETSKCDPLIQSKLYADTKKEPDDVLDELIMKLKATIEYEDDILMYNKNHHEYRKLIEKSYSLEAGIPERQYEGLSLAWLLLNTERSEVALRNFRDTGKINDFEELGIGQVRNARFWLLKANTERFLLQASSLNYQSQIWATLNFTMYLLEIIM